MSLITNLENLLKTETEGDRIDWQSYFSCLTLLISSRSSCQRLHVGCTLLPFSLLFGNTKLL